MHRHGCRMIRIASFETRNARVQKSLCLWSNSSMLRSWSYGNEATGKRFMSDNLLGHSPMAQTQPKKSAAAAGPAFGVDSNTAGGGVWAQTSAKRDKLAELKLENSNLDDAATPQQKMDLYLADGLKLVAAAADQAWPLDSDSAANNSPLGKTLKEFESWLTSTKQMHSDTGVTREQLGAHLNEAMRILSKHLPPIRSPSSSSSFLPSFLSPSKIPKAAPVAVELLPSFLTDVRDFMTSPKLDSDYSPPSNITKDLSSVQSSFTQCVQLHRILLSHAIASHLLHNWDTLTQRTNADIDRAAVRGETLPPSSSDIHLARVNDVLHSFAFQSCERRLQALWNLVDVDNDGLIDQEEMDRVAYTAIVPVQQALQTLLSWTIYVHPIYSPLPPLPTLITESSLSSSSSEVKKKGWMTKRKESKQIKHILKLFQKTVTNSFDVEIEMPHRLRCIYAWADKSHQSNSIDSILVDSTTISGRKRYVELHPKISHEEFVVEQREHFDHLDKVGEEYMKCFKEDLWVDQGTKRQNSELKRDCALFLGVVTLVDLVIVWM